MTSFSGHGLGMSQVTLLWDHFGGTARTGGIMGSGPSWGVAGAGGG